MPPHRKTIYILTQVINRYITTYVFDTLEEATENMQKLLFKALKQENFTDEDLNQYGMLAYEAWVNGHYDNKYDWSIVKHEISI